MSLPDFNLISAYGRRERPQMSKFTSPEVGSLARDRMEKTIPQSFLVLKNPGECRLILLILNWCHPATEVLKKHLSTGARVEWSSSHQAPYHVIYLKQAQGIFMPQSQGFRLVQHRTKEEKAYLQLELGHASCLIPASGSASWAL